MFLTQLYYLQVGNLQFQKLWYDMNVAWAQPEEGEWCLNLLNRFNKKKKIARLKSDHNPG